MDQGLATVVLSFCGTLIALVITKTVERAYLKRVDQAELSRDLVIHLANALPAIERLVPELAKRFEVSNQEDLRTYASEFVWSKLPLPLERLLQTFTGAKVHRLLITYFDRDTLLRAASDENHSAFYWLLDRAGHDWSNEPAAVERLETIQVARSRMLNYAREMLKLGYALMEELLSIAGGLPSYFFRGDVQHLLTELRRGYGLDGDGVSRRRAFYTPIFETGAGAIYDPSDRYIILRVQAPPTPALAASLRLSFDATGSALQRIRMLPDDEIAIPKAWTLRSIEAQIRSGRGVRQSAVAACCVKFDDHPSSLPYVLTLPNECGLALQRAEA